MFEKIGHRTKLVSLPKKDRKKYEGKEVELLANLGNNKWRVLYKTKDQRFKRLRVQQDNLEKLYKRCTLDVNHVDAEMQTPLMKALNACDELETRAEIARELMKRGADPNLKDKKGLTAIHFAVINGNRAAIEVTRMKGIIFLSLRLFLVPCCPEITHPFGRRYFFQNQ